MTGGVGAVAASADGEGDDEPDLFTDPVGAISKRSSEAFGFMTDSIYYVGSSLGSPV